MAIEAQPHYVSIITPSYNHASYIRQTIESVLAQDYPYVEHIVVDGGSADGTVEILREYGERYPERFRWVSEPDRGQSHAFNKGLAMARGEVIGWQNSDDYYYPDVFAQPIAYLLSHPAVAVVYGERLNTDDQGNWWDLPTGEFSYRDLLYRDYIANQSAFIRRSALVAVGGLTEDFHYAMDYDLWLRLGLAHEMAYLPGVRGVWRCLPTVKTASGSVKSLCERITAVEAILSSPALPAALKSDATAALMQHIVNALLVALAKEAAAERAWLIGKLRRPPAGASIPWEYMVLNLLNRLAGGASALASIDAHAACSLPRQVVALLDELAPDQRNVKQQVMALGSLYSALLDSRTQHMHWVLANVLRAAQEDRSWLRKRSAQVALARRLGITRPLKALRQALHENPVHRLLPGCRP